MVEKSRVKPIDGKPGYDDFIERLTLVQKRYFPTWCVCFRQQDSRQPHKAQPATTTTVHTLCTEHIVPHTTTSGSNNHVFTNRNMRK